MKCSVIFVRLAARPATCFVERYRRGIACVAGLIEGVVLFAVVPVRFRVH